MNATKNAILLVVLGSLVLASLPAGATALPREDMDLGWMQPGFTIVFAGSDHHSGPFPPIPEHVWHPSGWTRFTATITDVSPEARAVTVRYEGCVAAPSAYDLLWDGATMTCRTDVETYSMDTRESVDGSHCAVLWMTDADLRKYGACVGAKTVYTVVLLPDDVAVLSEEGREYCPVSGSGWIPCGWIPGSSYAYDLRTGLLRSTADLLDHATRVSASHG